MVLGPVSLRVERRPPRHRAVVVVVALAALALALEVQVAGYAFHLAGLSVLWIGVVLAASLVGSLVDVPVARLRGADPEVVYVPVRGWNAFVYLIPVERRPVTVAVNVGGALVPTAVSAYILVHTGEWLAAAASVLVVALVVHATAVPVRNVGILVPVLLPAVMAAAAGALLASSADAAAVAYVAASLGTLVGADLANARWMRRRMPGRALSIGGGGTFDGIFVAGVLAALLAAVL